MNTATSACPQTTGRIYLPTDTEFDSAAVDRIFNGRRPDRRPEAVLYAENDADVVAGVRWATANGWTVAVRSGGHSWASWSVREGGLLIDLSLMKEIELDEATGIVAARPAVKGGDELSPVLEAKGRFFNGGHCPSVGIGGFLLQGGQGWCTRGWGWAAESVVGIDVVTADGELIHANASEHSDLFWAARGSGPSFPGIVTRFHIQTRPLFGYLGFTAHAYPLEATEQVLAWLQRIHHEISENVEIVAVSCHPPALEDGTLPPRQFIVTGVALVDNAEQAREALLPLTTCPVIDQALMRVDAVESTMAAQRIEQERNNPEHARYVVDNAWIEGDPDEAAALMAPLFTEMPTPQAFSIWFSMAPGRKLPDMAFDLQADAYVATYYVYEDPAEDATHRHWLNEAYARMQPVTKGQYLGDSDMTNRQLKFMSDSNFAKLREIRRNRDPENRFADYLCQDTSTLNHNHWESKAN